MQRFEVCSLLRADAQTVWRHATSPQGVNREFGGLLRMTFPVGLEDFTDARKPDGRLFRSWILLAGILPVDYDDLCIVEYEPGRRFLERSTMLTQAVWEHERVVEPRPEGCRVRDRIGFQPRIGVLGPLFRPVFHAVFRFRHRRLRALFNGRADP